MKVHAVKVLMAGKKRWVFLGSGGSVNPLRVHALQFKSEEEAQDAAQFVIDNNPGVQAKVVALIRGRG